MLFQSSKLIGNLSTFRWIGSYTLLSIFIFLQPVYAGTLYCPQGELGSGGIYDPSQFKCFRGATVLKFYEYCEKGDLGSGGFYDTSDQKCFRGAVVNKHMMYCKQPGTGYRFDYPTNFQNASDCKNSYEGVLEVSGEAFVIRRGKKIPLEKGFDIVEGDKIQTGGTGQVAFKLKDGSKIRLSSNTDFTVDKYSYTNSCTTSNDFNICGRVYSLLQGLLVYTSEQMDKHSEKNIEFNTAVDGIGIRGTKFGMAQVINNAHGVNPGNYVKVYKGEIYLHNSAGGLDVPAGKAAYVANDKSRPIIIENTPGIFSK